MPSSEPQRANPVLVCILAWIIPGGGYLVMGEVARAFIAGSTIIFLLLAGILIGGIRVMDPPGFGQYGYLYQIVAHRVRAADGSTRGYTEEKIDPDDSNQAENPASPGDQTLGPALFRSPVAELGNKPWYVGQILCGPATLVASGIAVWAAHPPADATVPTEGVAASHSRSWEIGALYTAVAGMLNLLTIIDAAFRSAGSE